MTDIHRTADSAFDFVSPNEITDPIAVNLSWKTLKFVDNSFRAFRLHQVSDRKLELRRAPQLYIKQIPLLVVGVFLLSLASDLLQLDWKFAAIAATPALLVLYFAISRLLEARRPIILDHDSGISGAVLEGEKQESDLIAVQDVRALQILHHQKSASTGIDGEDDADGWDFFEINLVLADGRRAFLFSNGGGYKNIFLDMETLSTFLGVPVWGDSLKDFGSAATRFLGLVNGLVSSVGLVVFMVFIVFIKSWVSDFDPDLVHSSDALPAEAAVVTSPARVDELFGGKYTTDFGDLRLRALHQSGDIARFAVAGRYDTSNGIIEGNAEFDANKGVIGVVGVWSQKSSDRKCSEQKNGSDYWGTFRWQMQAGSGAVTESNLSDIRFDEFTGRWGYCDDQEYQAGSWNGTRVPGGSPMDYCEAPEFSAVHQSGCK